MSHLKWFVYNINWWIIKNKVSIEFHILQVHKPDKALWCGLLAFSIYKACTLRSVCPQFYCKSNLRNSSLFFWAQLFRRKGNKNFMISTYYIFGPGLQHKNKFSTYCLFFSRILVLIYPMLQDSCSNARSHKLRKMTIECFLFLLAFILTLLSVCISFSYYYHHFLLSHLLTFIKVLLWFWLHYQFIPLL